MILKKTFSLVLNQGNKWLVLILKLDVCQRIRKRGKIVVGGRKKRRNRRVESEKGKKDIIYSLPRLFVKNKTLICIISGYSACQS